MKKQFLLFFLLCLFGLQQVHAQQDANYSMYFSNGLHYNPGYAGSHEAVSLNSAYRYQWVRMPGAGQTATASVHSPLKKKRLALGAIYTYDQLGVNRTNAAAVAFAYRIPVGKTKETQISVGVSMGVAHYYSDLNSVATTESDDPAFAGNSQSRLMPDAGVGVYIYSRKFFVGASLKNLLMNRLDSSRTVFETSPDAARQFPHLFLTAGYLLKISSKVKFIPSVLFRYVPGHSPVSFDFNASFVFADRIRAGVSYRLEDSYVFMLAGHVTPQLRIGYAYDLTVSPLRKYTSGSHEITLGFDFTVVDKKMKVPEFIAHF